MTNPSLSLQVGQVVLESGQLGEMGSPVASIMRRGTHFISLNITKGSKLRDEIWSWLAEPLRLSTTYLGDVD